MRSVLLGNDFIEDESGIIKFLETNTNITFEDDLDTVFDLDPLFNFINEKGFQKVVVIINSPIVADWLKIKFQEKSIELEVIKTPQKSVTVPEVEDFDNQLILRISYDITAMVDTEYAADKNSFYNLINQENFAVKTYFTGDTIINFVPSYNNFPNYVVKGRVPNLDIKEYPRYYKLETIEEVQNLINNLSDSEMLCEFILSVDKIDEQLCTIRSLDILLDDLTTLNIGTYYKSMFFAKDEIGEFQYDTTGLLDQKYRYILTNDLRPEQNYAGDNTDELLAVDGTPILYQDITNGMEVKTILISDLPKENVQNLLGNNVTVKKWEDWTSTNDLLIQNSSDGTSTVNSYYWNLASTWMIKITLENGFQWTDSFETKMIYKKPDSDIISFGMICNFEIGDKIYFWNEASKNYEIYEITSKELVWETDKIMYTIDVNPDDVYLTTAWGDVKFVQHNIDCSCCFSVGFCGSICCMTQCAICTK